MKTYFQPNLLIFFAPFTPFARLIRVAITSSSGYGIGLSLALPQTKPNPAVRQLVLRDFPRVTIGAVWAGKPSPLTTAFVEAAQAHVQQMAAAK